MVPTYRALTFAGNVLQKDAHGDMRHAVVVDTTLSEEVDVIYVVTPPR